MPPYSPEPKLKIGSRVLLRRMGCFGRVQLGCHSAWWYSELTWRTSNPMIAFAFPFPGANNAASCFLSLDLDYCTVSPWRDDDLGHGFVNAAHAYHHQPAFFHPRKYLSKPKAYYLDRKRRTTGVVARMFSGVEACCQ